MKNKIIILTTILINLIISNQIVYSQWEECNNGIEDLHISALISLKKDLFVGTWGGKLYYSSDKGSKWLLKNSGLREWTIKSFAIKGDSLFTSCGGVYLTIDKGDNWMNKGVSGFDIHLAINNNIMYAGIEGYYVQKTTNFGENWSVIADGLTDKYIYSLVINDNKVYVGTEHGGIFTLDENGYGWSQLVTGEEIPNVKALAIYKDIIFAGSHGNIKKGLFISTNKGESWVKNEYLLDLSVYSIVITNNYIFLGTNDGFFLSSNLGSKWIQKKLGLPNTYITSIVSDSVHVFIGTGEGVFRAKISDLITDVETEKTVNQKFQIYPNPSSNNLNTKLDKNISNDLVKIKIYSGLGNEINFPDPVINADNIQIDVSGFPQGIYYLSIYNSAKVERTKFVKFDK
jgi:ligand-binding sensor domain-containing protein